MTRHRRSYRTHQIENTVWRIRLNQHHREHFVLYSNNVFIGKCDDKLSYEKQCKKLLLKKNVFIDSKSATLW